MCCPVEAKAGGIHMDHRFSDNLVKLCYAIERYIDADLTDDGLTYRSFDPPKSAQTKLSSDAVTLTISGLPIRGIDGTETVWESQRSDRWLASQRAWLALSDEGERTYIPPTVPYQSIVESVNAAYADLADEIVSDFVLTTRLFESLGYKHNEPDELITLATQITDAIRSKHGKLVLSGLIGNALADVGYVDNERESFSCWRQAACHTAERLSSLSARSHHEYTIAVLLNAPLLDSIDPVEIGSLELYGTPTVLSLGYATDVILSKTSRENPYVGFINTVVTMPMRISVDAPIETFLATYQLAAHVAQRVVDILRLVSADDIGVFGVEIIKSESMTPAIRKTWENTYQQDLSAYYPRRFMYRSPTCAALSEQQIAIVKRLTTKHIVQQSFGSGWEIAIRRFRDMYERHTPDDPELILAMAVAFEALYLNEADDSKHELSYRLRLRAARFLRGTVQDRQVVFDILRDLYGFRSRVAHGSSIENLKEADSKKLERVLAKCPELLKETLLAVLNGSGPWNQCGDKKIQGWREIELA
jgi:hypothetical protein